MNEFARDKSAVITSNSISFTMKHVIRFSKRNGTKFDGVYWHYEIMVRLAHKNSRGIKAHVESPLAMLFM